MSAVEMLYATVRERTRLDKDDRALGESEAMTREAATADAWGVAGDGSQPSSHHLLLKHMAQELGAVDPDGALVVRIADPRSAARLAILHTLSEAHWSAEIGPFYDGAGVGALLAHEGSSRSQPAVSERRDLLALRTGSGRLVYPAFQFDGRRPLDGLAEVLGIFEQVPVSRWTLASWLCTRSRELDDRSPIDVLRSGDVGSVLASSRRWAGALRA